MRAPYRDYGSLLAVSSRSESEPRGGRELDWASLEHTDGVALLKKELPPMLNVSLHARPALAACHRLQFTYEPSEALQNAT
jgi:hypothetical protein